jgi:hypothetical protein
MLNSFQATAEIRVARTYWRQRGEQVHGASTCIQRMQKVLTQMNVQLANVISDVSGLTGKGSCVRFWRMSEIRNNWRN